VVAADNSESRGYAAELMLALASAGLRISTTNPRMVAPIEMRATGNVKGVFIQVADVMNPPPNAKILSDALNEVGITTIYWRNLDYWVDSYALTVGLQ
jgi:hypothetical protein